MDDQQLDPEQFDREETCTYRNETYLVGDNGAVYRCPKEGYRRKRSRDEHWTFGTKDEESG